MKIEIGTKNLQDGKKQDYLAISILNFNISSIEMGSDFWSILYVIIYIKLNKIIIICIIDIIVILELIRIWIGIIDYISGTIVNTPDL